MSERVIRLVVLGTLAVLVLATALAYVTDALWVRYRATLNRANDPLEAVTLFVGTKLKNGQIEIYNQPVTEVCVHALFPHGGHRPCWYVRRSPVKLV
jgi:hypothetical protein